MPRGLRPFHPAALPAQELLASSTLGSLRAHFVDAERALKALQAEGRGENHPATRAAQAQLDSVRTALLSEVKNIQEAYARDASSAAMSVRYAWIAGSRAATSPTSRARTRT